MLAENLGHVDGQRAVHENGDRGEAVFSLNNSWSSTDQQLGAAHGEGRNDDLAAAPAGPVDDLGQLGGHGVYALVQPVAVSALHDDVVGARHAVWVADDGLVGAADIARIDHFDAASILVVVQHDRRRAQDVAGVVSLVAQRRVQDLRRVERNGLEQLERVFGVGQCVERLDLAVVRRLFEGFAP